MSEFKTDKIKPVDAGSTTTLGESGDTIATSSGTTLDIQGTYSGINAISWDTTAKTANFTAETNKGYFINTTSGGVTITLPATPVAGSFIGIKDYALTAQTNNITIAPNGNKIQGVTSNFLINTQGGSANLVYVDATQGWLTFDAAQASDIAEQQLFITATGGTITTCGDFKIHTFTGPGTFCVSQTANPAGGPNAVDYLVVAGGGSGAGQWPGADTGGGGGAGGYRTSFPSCGAGSIPISVQGYPIVVGGGGAGETVVGQPGNGNNGNPSSFSTITSAGGGKGGGGQVSANANSGGSGGGGSRLGLGGSGNTPPVSPPQGNAGANGINGPGCSDFGGGGGGAVAAATNQNGGAGSSNSITGSSVAYAGGGGGAGRTASGGSGGTGGGGAGAGPRSGPNTGGNGTINTGGGGGGAGSSPTSPASIGIPGSGGSGIVVIRYRYQ